MGDVRCAAPEPLAGKLLSALPEEELICDGRITTTTTEIEFSAEDVTEAPEEPDIITSEDATTRRSAGKGKGKGTSPREPQPKTASPYNMDALIIGIVGGVVAFIAIIIVIICVVRLRLTDSQYRGGPLAGPLALRAQGKCTCLKPVPPTIYGNGVAAANGSVANGGYALSYPSTPVPPHHAPPALALTWGGGTINSQKMLPPPPPASVHGGGGGGGGPGSTFGTVGAHSYAGTVVSRAGSHHAAALASYPGTFAPGYPVPPGATPYYVTFPAEEEDSESDDSPGGGGGGGGGDRRSRSRGHSVTPPTVNGSRR